MKTIAKKSKLKRLIAFKVARILSEDELTKIVGAGTTSFCAHGHPSDSDVSLF